MVVRDRAGRGRYVVFVVTPPVEKARLVAALKTAPGPDRLRLVEYDGARGLVRCPHTAKDRTIAFLTALRVGGSRVRTVGTSGTIRKARAKYFAPRDGSRELAK